MNYLKLCSVTIEWSLSGTGLDARDKPCMENLQMLYAKGLTEDGDLISIIPR